MTYEHWRARFLEASDERFFPADWLDHMVRSGTAQFWGNDEGAILAAVRGFPSGAREVHGIVAAGGIEAIRALIPFAEERGRALGCLRASISSSPAWGRIMRADGYQPHQLTICKDL